MLCFFPSCNYKSANTNPGGLRHNVKRLINPKFTQAGCQFVHETVIKLAHSQLCTDRKMNVNLAGKIILGICLCFYQRLTGKLNH